MTDDDQGEYLSFEERTRMRFITDVDTMIDEWCTEYSARLGQFHIMSPEIVGLKVRIYQALVRAADVEAPPPAVPPPPVDPPVVP